MIFEKFKEYCLKGKCLKNSFKSKRCLLEDKQKRCFDKYLMQKSKIKKIKIKKYKEDKKIIEIKLQCWKRDTGLETIPANGIVGFDDAIKYCMFLKTFNCEEKREFMNYAVRYIKIFCILDWIHILGRKENKYKLETTMIGNRLSHSWFDKYLSPVNGEPITSKEREIWQQRFLETVKKNNERNK